MSSNWFSYLILSELTSACHRTGFSILLTIILYLFTHSQFDPFFFCHSKVDYHGLSYVYQFKLCSDFLFHFAFFSGRLTDFRRQNVFCISTFVEIGWQFNSSFTSTTTTGGAVAQSVECTTYEEVPGSIPAVVVHSLLVG